MSFTLNKVTSKGANMGTYEPLQEGKYDAVLHAIIGLEMQKHIYLGVDQGVVNKVLMLFELPAETRKTKDGDQLPALMSYELTLSTHEKSTFLKVVSALLHKPLDSRDVETLLESEEGVSSLLGKTCTVTVREYKNKLGQIKNAVKSVTELDKRLTQPVAVRDPFVFTVANPDLDIFRNRLIGWTRDKIMSAINADEFPKAIHEAYRDIKELEAETKTNKLV